MATDVSSEGLQGTPRVVRKGRQRDEREGGAGLQVRDRGSERYLKGEQGQEVEDGLGAREPSTGEEGRVEIEARYGIVYQSQQSDYDLLDASGLRYHQTEKSNPKRSEAQGLERREESKKTWDRGGKRFSGEK